MEGKENQPVAQSEQDLIDESTDGQDEFDYDSDGNIVIPDVVFNDDDEADEIVVDEEPDEGNEESGEDTDQAAGESGEPDISNDADNLEEFKEYKRRYEELVAQSKDTLSKLGRKDTDDVLAELESVAAEAADIPLDEYREKKKEAERT